MRLVWPFRAVFYDRAGGDPGQNAAPPYDIVGVDDHARLLAQSPHNVIRFTLGERPGEEGDFSSAAQRLAGMLRDGILSVDAAPRYWIYTADYTCGGAAHAFAGLVCNVDVTAGRVHNHERTLPRVKDVRFKQLCGARANLGLVFLVSSDPDGLLRDTLRAACGDVRVRVPVGGDETHAVHAVSEGEAEKLAALAERGELVIADGHHRFQTAVRYHAAHPDDPQARYCLVVVGSLAPGSGCSLLPYHRAIRFPAVGDARAWAQDVVRGFQPAGAGPADLTLFYPGAEAGVPLTYAGAADSLVAHLHARYLDRLAGEDRVVFTRDLAGVMKAVQSGEPFVALALRAVAGGELMETVMAGRVLPPKSTYFRPKLHSGMVMRLLDQDR